MIFEGGWPILRVTHDEDGDWHFLDGSPAWVEDAVIVCLSQVLERDPTIAELSDLPAGWTAWRLAPDCLWTREPSPWTDEDLEERAGPGPCSGP
jgi:hypothetical protein